MADWKAGVAELGITPPLGVAMTGYAGRPGPADHVLDPLYVRALALQCGEAPPVVLTGADLLGAGAETVEQIRRSVAHLLPPERLLLNYSHTHAGPTVTRLRCMGEPDAAYVAILARWTASAVRMALRGLRPARVFLGRSETAIGMNRRELREGRIVLGQNEAGAYDPAVYVLRVEAADGRPLACWFSHGTHPVVMDNRNTGLSAEWPGAAAATLASLLGCPALFAQGCCGDINPVRRGDYSVVRSVGRELAGAALAAWERAEPLAATGAAAALDRIRLPLQKPTREEAEQALAEAREREAAARAAVAAAPSGERHSEVRSRFRIAREMRQWATEYLEASRELTERGVFMEAQAVRLGDLCLLGTSAETFVEIGQELRRRSPFPHTVPLGYTNGCFGYLPTEKAFPQGGYEVDGAFKYYGTLMVTPDCERLTYETADRLLSRLEQG